MMTMENFLYILPWNVLALTCAVLLLTTLHPLGKVPESTGRGLREP